MSNKRTNLFAYASVFEAILIVILLFFVFTNFQEDKSNDESYIVDSEFTFTDSVKYNAMFRFLCDSNTIVQDSSGNNLFLNEYLGDFNIVFRFSENDCSNCAANELDYIEKNSLFKSNRIIILNSVKYNWELRERTYQIGTNGGIFYIPDSCINLHEVERFNKPYYVLIDQYFKVQDLLYLSETGESKKNAILESWFHIQNRKSTKIK